MKKIVLCLAVMIGVGAFAMDVKKCGFALLSDSLEGRWQAGPGIPSLRKVAIDDYDLSTLTREELDSYSSLTIAVNSKRPATVTKTGVKKPVWTDDTAFQVTQMKRPEEPIRYAVRGMQAGDVPTEQLALRALTFMKEGAPSDRPLHISFYRGNEVVKKSGTAQELEIWLKKFARGKSEGTMFISSKGPVPLSSVEVAFTFGPEVYDASGKLSYADEEPNGSEEKQWDIKFPQSAWDARFSAAAKSFIADASDPKRFDKKSVESAAEQVLEKLTSQKPPAGQ